MTQQDTACGLRVDRSSVDRMLMSNRLLVGCFGLAGLPAPWRGLLFAYAAGQLAGRLVPLPGGLGGREGGALDALTLTGTPAARVAVVVIVYRVAGYWANGATGTAAAARAGAVAPHTVSRKAIQRTLGTSCAATRSC